MLAPTAVPLFTTTPLRSRSTFRPALTLVMLKVGWLTLVTLSVAIFESVVRSGASGAVSTLTLTAPDCGPVDPPTVWRAV